MRSVRAVAVAGVVALRLVGQEPPADVDPVLAELLQAAEARPDLVAAREQTRAAEDLAGASGTLPDPMLSLDYVNDGWAPSLGQRDMSLLQLTWSQALPAAGKRRLRAERALGEARLEGSRVDVTRHALRAAVKRGYARLRLARSLLALEREQLGLLRETEGVARARYAVGQGGQQDVLRAQVELTRAEPALEALQAEATQRLYELNRLAGRALDTPIETPPEWELRRLVLDDEGWLARVRNESPELASVQVQADASRVDVDLARRESQPDWTVLAGYANRGRLDPMWQAGVALSLPLRRGRLAAGVAAAEARARAASARRAALAADVELAVRRQLLQVRAAERSMNVYDQGLLPQGRLSVEAAIAGYQAGRVPFVAVIEAQSSLSADRAARLRLVAAHAVLVAGLEEAQLAPALELAPVDPGGAGTGGPSPMAMER